MKCNAPSYDGNEAYAYFVYCAEDTGAAFPSIERMARSGLRICYPDYDSFVSASYHSELDRIKKSNGVIVFLTDGMITSHLARKFVNTATENRKRMVVIRYNDVQPTPAMKMQFEKAVTFEFFNFHADPLTETVFGAPVIRECIGSPNNGIAIQKIATHRMAEAPVEEEMMDENSIREIEKVHNRWKTIDIKDAIEKEGIRETSTEETLINADALDETVDAFDVRMQKHLKNIRQTERKLPELPLIVSMTTGEWKRGRIGDAIIGRKKNAETDGDITFSDSCRLFSGKHFQLINLDEIRSIVSLHANGMSIDGETLEKGDKALLNKPISEIVIPGDRALAVNQAMGIQPGVFAIALDNAAAEVMKAGRLASLTSVETRETRFFCSDSFMLGKNYKWEKGAMSSKTISKMHATVSYKDRAYEILVHSSNGLYINDRAVKKDESVVMQSGDKLVFPGNIHLGIQPETLVYRMVVLQNES